MGMGYATAALAFDPQNLRRVMDSNRFWFALAQCTDGSDYDQSNRAGGAPGASFVLPAARRKIRIVLDAGLARCDLDAGLRLFLACGILRLGVVRRTRLRHRPSASPESGPSEPLTIRSCT